MKIIDCFTFYNELELLKYRLNLLNSSVDYFVLAEATHTHTGFSKPLYFQENKALFKEFEHKIIHVIVNDFPFKKENERAPFKEGYSWTNEQWQRDALKRGLSSLSIANEDQIILCDLDEIPNPATLTNLQKNPATNLCILQMDMYFYTLQNKLQDPWRQAKIAPYSYVKNVGSYSKNIRFGNTNTIINSGGWHLSYFMSPSSISNKMKNFAHQEFNRTEFTEPNVIRTRIEKGSDPYDRHEVIVQKISISENTNLPPLYETYLSAFC
uniref:Uncharacterized protein n=1 Tax=viral metagenome TaxID=1070528 RepID=A0A6C0KW60_9ZZZZ